MSSDSEILAGQVLGETYRIDKLLAEGGVGSVYLASHVRLPNKLFAVKILRSLDHQDDRYLRFRREAEIATRIGHPNIVDVIDFNHMEDGRPYIVMTYHEGETLGARLRRLKRLEPIEVAALIGQLASGLAAAHAIGVVHRDIKPDNIFLVGPLDGPINCKILDFGISKIRDSGSVVTAGNFIMGTLYYMSPEQATAQTEKIDATTDIFALGTLTYQLITGRIPFRGATPFEVIDGIVRQQPDWDLLPPATRPPLQRAMHKDRTQRQCRVDTFSDTLRAALSSSSTLTWIPRSRDDSNASPLEAETDDYVDVETQGATALTFVEKTHAAKENVAEENAAEKNAAEEEGSLVTGSDARAPVSELEEAPTNDTSAFFPPPDRDQGVSRRRKLVAFGVALLALAGAIVAVTSMMLGEPPATSTSVVATPRADAAAPSADQRVEARPSASRQPDASVTRYQDATLGGDQSRVAKKPKKPRQTKPSPRRKRARKKRPATKTQKKQGGRKNLGELFPDL